MGVIEPAAKPRRSPVWMTGGITILTFVGLLYVVEAINALAA